MTSTSITVQRYTGAVCTNTWYRASPSPLRVLCGSSNEDGIRAWKEMVCEAEGSKRAGKAMLDIENEPSLVSGSRSLLLVGGVRQQRVIVSDSRLDRLEGVLHPETYAK
jgi:hypothetical protein